MYVLVISARKILVNGSAPGHRLEPHGPVFCFDLVHNRYESWF